MISLQLKVLYSFNSLLNICSKDAWSLIYDQRWYYLEQQCLLAHLAQSSWDKNDEGYAEAGIV